MSQPGVPVIGQTTCLLPLPSLPLYNFSYLSPLRLPLLFTNMAHSGAEFSQIDMESSEEASDMLFGNANRRCCFCIPRFTSSNRSSSSSTVRFNWWNRVRTTDETEGEGLWSRSVAAVMKIREWSEIVAGPKWKTFIRRFNRNKASGQSKYQYDPLSYALNFDEGPGQNGNSEENDDYRFRNFSARYATAPLPANSSMDLGKDGPNFS